MPDISADTIRAKADSLALKIKRLRDTLATTEREHAALLMTLSLFEPPAPKRSRRPAALDISPDELRGKSLDDALFLIAERNDGVLLSTAARELLVAAGVLTVCKPATRCGAPWTGRSASPASPRGATAWWTMPMKPNWTRSPRSATRTDSSGGTAPIIRTFREAGWTCVLD